MDFELTKWKVSELAGKAAKLGVPPFQRESEAWDLRKKKLLIDSILRGWRIPKLYLDNSKRDTYWMIDGQQRIGAILEFINDGFEVVVDDSEENYTFSSLAKTLQDKILDYPIDIEVITGSDEKESSILFSRLQEGVELNQWEKLNAITGKLADFIVYVEQHDFFAKIGIDRKRYGLKGLCQQILFFEVLGIRSSTFAELRDFFEKNRNFDDPKIKQKITSTLDYMNKIFPDEMAYTSKVGNVVSVFLLCSWLLSRKVDLHPRLLHRFFTIFSEALTSTDPDGDRDFKTYNIDLIQPASESKFITSRNHILKKHLCLYEPKLIEYLNQEELKEFLASMEESFRDKSKQINSLANEINERAIGAGKHKIFNLTTQNSAVFTRMSYPVRSLQEYEELIDLLWKAFYEGSDSANKIGNLEPDRGHTKPVRDINVLIKINDLRTIGAHDLEQDPSTYEQKVKYACDIRELFTGKKHVRDFDSNAFIVFQFRIVNELHDFMKQLNKSFK